MEPCVAIGGAVSTGVIGASDGAAGVGVAAPPPPHAEVAKGAQFQVTWTGPNAPGDYVTIVPVGSAPSVYLSYFNTITGSPGTLTAPDSTGDHEVWYVATQGPTVLKSILIKVR